MKKIILIMSLIVCVLLTACKKDVTDQKNESLNQSSGVSEVLLYDANDLKLSMKAVYSAEGNRKSVVLNMSNGRNEEITATLEAWTLNGTYRISEYYTMFLDPMEDSKKVMEEVSSLVYTEEIDSIKEIAFHLSIRDGNYDMIEEKDIHIVFEENLIFALDYNSFLGAKVNEQILRDDEHVKVTLLEWGRNPDNNYVETIVKVENTSDEMIPAMISGMNINGVFFENKSRVHFLEPGYKCFLTTNALISEFEDEGITSVVDIEMLIMTEECENTGIVNYSGGSWYPVILAEKGETEEQVITGELLTTFEGVDISYIGQDESDWAYGGGAYDWNLSVVNNSDENIKIAIVDVLIDGVPEEIWHNQMQDCSLYFASSDVGAHSKRNVSISLSCEETMIERPELTFKFQIRSMAGGSVIATGEEVITITPDQE